MTRPATLLLPLGLLVSSPVLANEKSQALHESGVSSANVGDFEQAKTFFKQAVKADPKDFLAVFDLGGAQEALHEYEAAAKSYAKAVELNPEFIEAQKQAGTLYLMQLKQPERAIKHFKFALLTRAPWSDKRFPVERTRAQTLQNLAVAYAEMGAYGTAAAIADQALAQLPVESLHRKSFDAIWQKANAEADTHSELRTKAFLDVERAVHGERGVRPADALARYRAFEKTASIEQLTDREKWAFYDGYGLALAMTDQVAASKPYFEKAIAASKPLRVAMRSESLYNLACALASLGQLDEAFVQFEEVLWLERVTKLSSQWRGRTPYSKQAKTDDSLANLRKDPRFDELLARYR